MNKQIEEMRYLADEMGKAISTECEKRYLADERKLEAVLKANGWHKQSAGEWIVCGMFDDFFKCSSCGYKSPWQTAIEFKYCPNCGARMKGENDG